MSISTIPALAICVFIALLIALAVSMFSFVFMILRWRRPQRRGHVIRLLLSLAAIPCLIGGWGVFMWLLFNTTLFREQVTWPPFQQDPSAPLPDRIANATRNARLTGMRALAILQGDDAGAASSLVGSLSDYAEHPEVLPFFPLIVSQKTIGADAPAFGKLGWPLPGPSEVVLVALDNDATPLGAERIDASDPDAAKKRIAGFLKQRRPPVRDARARFAAAKDEAGRSDRKVWIVESGARCGPCFRLARWIDDQHALLEKDYVILELVDSIDQHAPEVIDPLNPAQDGVPWFAILDANGKILTTSDGPMGNVGIPTTLEDIQHLREMLLQTSQRLTAEDIDQLAGSLEGYK